MTNPNKLTIEDVEKYTGREHEVPDTINIIARALADTMRENERLREILSTMPNCPQQYWNDGRYRAEVARQQALNPYKESGND